MRKIYAYDIYLIQCTQQTGTSLLTPDIKGVDPGISSSEIVDIIREGRGRKYS